MARGKKFSIKKASAPNADINVTPLVDVVLVLLIIFMVVTPMLQRGKDVRLPQVSKP
ncbi:MAG TPA: biopolymer transporter ExbD, partial [Polyangiaceae bacterium]|nr:biopolymer transporter ExbD [Polyangiaceae bacterium]